MTNTDRHLFLVSTPLHLLVSLAIVDAEKLEHVQLMFIDQVVGKANVYLKALEDWDACPFNKIDVFYQADKSNIKKLKHRKKVFASIHAIIEEFKPNHLYVGNDRRIEFQYAMHAASEMQLKPSGYYLDEGTFTYVGRKASFSFSDKYIDSTIKKLSYGFWWKHPPTVGASDWITTVYASFPEEIHVLLRAKEIRPLTLRYWQSSALKSFCHLLLDDLAKSISFDTYDVIITLPHESIIASRTGYSQLLTAIINSRVKAGLSVAVKYHPRDKEKDALNISMLESVELLPAAIPFEAMLPMLKEGVEVLGDFSTALITARLLMPSATVNAIVHEGAAAQTDFETLYQRIGVNCLEEVG